MANDDRCRRCGHLDKDCKCDGSLNLQAPPHDPGILSLAGARRRRELETENTALRADIDRLSQVIASHDTMIVSGKVTEHSRSVCRWHNQVVVDEDSPRVECATCGTELDAHQVLLELARKERTFRSWTHHYVEEQKKLRAEVERLKKERSNLRTQIKGAARGTRR